MEPMMDYYGCCLCQRTYLQDEALYQQHIYHQSKHGIRRVSVKTADEWRQAREERDSQKHE